MSESQPQWHIGPDHALHGLGRRALAAGIVGIGVCAAGVLVSPVQFLRSYLVAYLFWTQAALGCLALLMLQYVTGGAWGATIRRLLESGVQTLPLMAILFAPIALGTHELYEWAHADIADDPILLHKQAYLNVPFFLARAVFYFMAWLLVAGFLRRWSLEQDRLPGPGVANRLEQLSRGGLLLLGLTATFASIDWAMSLEPHWFSTIYGILFMGGSVLTAFALSIAVGSMLATRAPLSRVFNPECFHDLGKLMLAFVLLWAYFSFSQFLVTWSGNLPEETPWYIRRLTGGWDVIAIVLILFHFAVPFFVLLSRNLKRKARTLTVVAVALLVMRFVDVFWLVTPVFRPTASMPNWLDAGTMLAVGGLWLAVFVRQLTPRPVVPLHDPALPLET